VNEQHTPYDSPWTLQQRLAMLAWEACWAILCAWTPKPLNPWRLLVLRVFGAQLHGYPFVHQRARIAIPWNIILHDRATIGDRANLYSLTTIELGPRAIVAQEAYLCTGTHALDDPALALQVAPIRIGADAFIGARAFLMPGINVGPHAVIGACAVVTKDVLESQRVAGNPARPFGSPAPTPAS